MVQTCKHDESVQILLIHIESLVEEIVLASLHADVTIRALIFPRSIWHPTRTTGFG
jgi:hypothetical protein